MSRDPRVLSDEELYKGFVRLSRVTIEADWQGRAVRFQREIHDHGDIAAVVPVDPERGMVILLRQFRASPFLDGGDGWLWEIPAGLLDGEAPEACARREAQEEAGLDLREIAFLGAVWTSPGIVKEKVHLFRATYSGPPPSTVGGLDHESEMIEVHEMPLAEVSAMLDAGEITDAKTALALHMVKAAAPGLFG